MLSVLKDAKVALFRIVIEAFNEYIHKFLEFYLDD